MAVFSVSNGISAVFSAIFKDCSLDSRKIQSNALEKGKLDPWNGYRVDKPVKKIQKKLVWDSPLYGHLKRSSLHKIL